MPSAGQPVCYLNTQAVGGSTTVIAKRGRHAKRGATATQISGQAFDLSCFDCAPPASSTTAATTTTATPTPTAPPCAIDPQADSTLSCGVNGVSARSGSAKFIITGAASSAADCADQCAQFSGCLSFGYSAPAVGQLLGICDLYSSTVANLAPTRVDVAPAGQMLQQFFDVGCYSKSNLAFLSCFSDG